ncbi:hypothetical protein Lbys_3487 [Leadbetterella byssophila DSM 17132]|uniref:Uncharacterized protein n=1 Tax=Leadbetterella byssophila (strain DSM 17132 / JCM 16389 / KACC 11308 / NBRC 106382 / 4M15) TaxID=649349 RepID=E4RYK5_LEAB4|nr:hypothetical protein Lbys_3487 [Leadbetterella byssophila DSM 17132]
MTGKETPGITINFELFRYLDEDLNYLNTFLLSSH